MTFFTTLNLRKILGSARFGAISVFICCGICSIIVPLFSPLPAIAAVQDSLEAGLEAVSGSNLNAESASISPLRALMFRPLRANVFEPRTGAMVQTYQADAANQAGARRTLRLDIGLGVDLLAIPLGTNNGTNNSAELRLGSEFFTLTRLRSEANFRFPVETTDFFFGVNASVQTQLGAELWLSGRLRVAHISSHLVDGVATFRQTFVYSREFVDAVAALDWRGNLRSDGSGFRSVRVYAGANVLFHTIPENFGVFMPQFGVDAQDYALLGGLGIRSVGLCAGYDLKFSTINGSTTAVHAAQAGLRFGAANAPGVFVGGYWYEGKSVHGMFFNERDSYLAIGFQLDL